MKIRQQHINRWRLWVLSMAFLLLVLTPLLNYYLQVDFIQGWFQSLSIGELWFVSPLEGLERLLVSKEFYGPLLVGMLLPLLLATLCGRVFCSWVCPISFLSECGEWLSETVRRSKKMPQWLILPRYTIWLALAGELLLTMLLGAPLFVFLSPPGIVGRELMTLVFFQTLGLEIVVLIAVLAVNLLVTQRLYCRYLCPLGGLLAVVGRKRRLQVVVQHDQCVRCNQCQRVCPLGLAPQQGDGQSSQCWNCGICVAKCQQQSLQFKWDKR
jgi:ferredoxin-type protein NapH